MPRDLTELGLKDFSARRSQRRRTVQARLLKPLPQSRRVKAWLRSHELKNLKLASFLLEAVQIRSPEDLALLEQRIAERGLEPALIVLDTLARCFVGGNENLTGEMGGFVYAIEDLQRETGAAVLVLHHTPRKDPDNERGSVALRAAADTMVRVKKASDGLISVTNNKQKDDEEFEPINLRLKQVVIGQEGERDVTSCVLVPASSAGATEASIDKGCLRTLAALNALVNRRGDTADWRKKAKRPERTFYDHQKKLERAGYVTRVRRGHFRVTDAGKKALQPAAAG